VLALVGIGAASAAGSVVVDGSKQKEQNEAIARVEAQPDSDAKSALLKDLHKRTEGFLNDILSDADGISIHRFQMVAWTLVLTFIFVREIYDKLAMSDFEGNLLTLQGISAATYVGLKLAAPGIPKA